MTPTIIDGGVAVILLISGLLAAASGFTREVLRLISWGAAALIALYVAPSIQGLVQDLPVVGPILRSSCWFSLGAALLIAFVLALIFISIITSLLTRAVAGSSLGGIDSGLGFLFGVLRGVVIVALAYAAYMAAVPADDRNASVTGSISAGILGDVVTAARDMSPSEMPDWISGPFVTVMNSCPAEGVTDAATQPAATPATNTSGDAGN